MDPEFVTTFQNLKPGDVLYVFEDGTCCRVGIRRKRKRRYISLYPPELFSHVNSLAATMQDIIAPLLELYAGVTLHLEDIQDKAGKSLSVKDTWDSTASTNWNELSAEEKALVFKIKQYKFVVRAIKPRHP